MRRLSRPTLRQLEYLVAVEETLGFREAARRCHVSQPALSAQLQQLEASLGVTLFERDRRHVVATAAGLRLAEEARAVLSRMDCMLDAVHALHEPLSGQLRLGTIPTVGPYVLPQVVAPLHATFPQLRLLLREEKAADLNALLTRGELDVLLLDLDVDLAGTESVHLFDDTFHLACHARHPLATKECICAADLEGETVLLLDDGHCLRSQTRQLCRDAGASEASDVRGTSLMTLVQMVAMGVGVTLLPEMAIERERASAPTLAIRPCHLEGWQRRIGLAWREGSPRAEEFRALGDRIAGAWQGADANTITVP